MTRLRALIGVALLVAACGGGAKTTKEEKKPAGPAVPEAKLKEHLDLQEALKTQGGKFVSATEAYGTAKGVYSDSVGKEMGPAKADSRATKQVQGMAEDGKRNVTELLTASKSLNDALVARATEAHKLIVADSQLLDAEAQAYGGKDAAKKKVEAEIKTMRDALTALQAAQKDEQAAITALSDKETEVADKIGDDPKARDAADSALTDLRTALDKAFAKLLETATKYDEAAAVVHKKLKDSIPPGKAKKDQDAAKALGDKMGKMLEERAAAAAALAKAREALKAATLARAEKRSQEVSYDGEVGVVVSGAFKKPPQKEAFLGKVKGNREAATAARAAMQTEDKALTELRKKIVQLEADIAGLGY